MIFLRADRVEGASERYVEASGKVELRTRSETVLADWLRYDFLADEIWGKGDVLIRRGIDWITGPELRFKRDTETGVFSSPRFFIGENGSRGSAAEIRFTGPNQYEASDARYTTCVAPRDDWYIRMDELEVDRSRMIGTGHDATVYFLGAPIIYSPWLEFPLSGERKSGFLTPVLGSSGIRGFEYAQPYYLNLAPNYDATIAPRLMTKRGLQIAGQGRYLFDTAQGEATAEYLYNDRVTGETRWGVSWKHTQNLGFLPGLVGYWNLNKVSDDTYFADLSDRVGLTSQTTLPREAGLAYTNAPWTFIARAQTFQTLVDPSLPPGPPPYNRVPQFLAALQEVDWKGLTFAGTAEYADFRNPTLVTGQRAYAYPTVAWTKQGPAWYFTATTGVHARHYSLNDTTPDRESQDYVIPITTLDAGLVFERDWSAYGQSFVQTLEPRAYYVYVPYKDQSKAPIFDTAIDDYNFAQLFSSEPLSRQRPDRRRQPDHARADVAAPRSDHRRGAPARRDRRALLFPGSARDAERGAAVGLVVGLPDRRRGQAVGRVGAGRPDAVQLRPVADRATGPRRSATRRRPARPSTRATAIRGCRSTRWDCSPS